jgi:low affinity Fe/Cu permease
MHDWFLKLSRWASDAVGSPAAFLIGVLVVVTWLASGPYFHYSDTWQLVINTGTTIGTFLIVFLIQHTQNRDARVMHLKLDELIRAVKTARTELVQMEELSDEDLDHLQKQFEGLRDHASLHLKKIAASRKVRSKTEPAQ